MFNVPEGLFYFDTKLKVFIFSSFIISKVVVQDPITSFDPLLELCMHSILNFFPSSPSFALEILKAFQIGLTV